MKCKTQFHLLVATMLVSMLILGGCGNDGTNGTNGTDGVDGANGTNGIDGVDGSTYGDNFRVTTFHGKATLESTGEFDETLDNPKYYADASITSATADAAGLVTVNFNVQKDGVGVTGLGLPIRVSDGRLTGLRFSIAKLVPAGAGLNPDAFSRWVPYATGDRTGALTDHGDGNYTYVFVTDISDDTVTGTTYERNLTTRIAVMMGGHSGATASPTLDFIPAGGAVTATRNIVPTEACKTCHGDEFHGHGGDRITVEACVTCHNPSLGTGGEADFKIMIHKIHAGGELPSTLAAADAVGADNVWEMTDQERADANGGDGLYTIGGDRSWWKIGFPAVLENCTKCHQDPAGGSVMANVNNWKTVPSRASCGSCHDTTTFEGGAITHTGGEMLSDATCTSCHKADTASGFAPSVTEAHDWTQKDIRNINEFVLDVSFTGDTGSDADGSFFQDGDAPLLNIKIYRTSDLVNPVNPLTWIKDTVREHCTSVDGSASGDVCGGDGNFDKIALMVHGPRAQRNPVLSTVARVEVVSTVAGPYVIGATANLGVVVDNGQNLNSTANGGTVLSGTISVSVPAATYTAQEMADLLNANTAFAARAIAYVQENSFHTGTPNAGNIAIRSRNLGKLYAIQIPTGAVASVLFAPGQLDVTNVLGGYTASNNVVITTALGNAANDPKATWTATDFTYQLDPVDDLQAGTYIVSMEVADVGRTSDTDYRTPSFIKAPFQVKQGKEELPPAGNCGSACHQSPEGTGFVLDYPRHNKEFDDTAIDQCAGCHDYQSQNAAGAWTGALSINKRVHAVHNGANLNYPVLTVGHADAIAARLWDIDFPQDIRNCETCHKEDTTSGSWKTRPARMPCSGCHDSDVAEDHMASMTVDPTPASPWSGDEGEACQVCH